MATDNEQNLTDYYANAAGGGLRFETAPFRRLQFGVSGFYIFNIGSSDLSQVDFLSGQTNRYEIGLFDIENPRNKKDLDRLEELYLRYHHKQLKITFGRQLINSPFINLQDGRMRPTGVEGLWIEASPHKKLKLEGGILYAISPRSTTRWYYVGESIGVYQGGVSESGTKSKYGGNTESNYVINTGIQYQPNNQLQLKAWNLFVDNIFNTTLLQADYKYPLNNKTALLIAAQNITQSAIGNGGNIDPALAYISKQSTAFTYGARIGIKQAKFEINANYNRITASSRYLMPREWGRDPFFTFMPRERNEGMGDVHAFVLKSNAAFYQSSLKVGLSLGHFKTPHVSNTRLNKYGLPSYLQVNADLRYSFDGFFKGLDVQFMPVLKIRTGDDLQKKRFVHNKNNMVLYNLVLNYHF